MPINAKAELSFLLLPPLKSWTNFSLNSFNLKTFINELIMIVLDSFLMPLRLAINSNVWTTVKYSGSISNWGQKPKFLNASYFLVSISCPFMKPLPLVASISPINILNVVDFPAPFKPSNLKKLKLSWS